MSSMKTNILTAIAAVLFLTMSAACNTQNKKTESEEPQATIGVTKTTEDKSMEFHNKLMSSFNPNWETEEPVASDYPAYYGGSFIDNDGKFVVCVVGNPAQHRSTIAGIIGSDDFLTESCTYSYRQMMEVMDRIDLFLSDSTVPNTHPFLSYFAGAGADVFKNRVIVHLTELNAAAIQAFKKDVSGSPVVEFEKGEMPVMM